MKKFCSLLLAVLLMFGLALPAQASAGEVFQREDFEYAAQAGFNFWLELRRIELEQRFDIRIRYDVDMDGRAAIGTGALATLGTVLGYLTPGVVRQLSEYWEERTGNQLTFAFVYSPFQNYAPAIGGEVLGAFHPCTALIELYIPAFGSYVFISGESPLTILHELGHAFHSMAADLHGEDRLRAEWTVLNGSASYTSDRAASRHDPFTFVSRYAAFSYEEDFAEVFAHAFVRHKAGQGFSHYLRLPDGGLSPLGRKVEFLEELLALYFDDYRQMVENFRRVWTAPAVLDLGGLVLSGSYTQYMGFTHPRFVLRSLAGKLGIELAHYRWVPRIGGWIVTSTDGGRYVIFPGSVAFILREQPGNRLVRGEEIRVTPSWA